MDINRILYVLPKADYFNRGRCGSIVHALGVISGLEAQGVEVSVLSGPDGGGYFQNSGFRVTYHSVPAHSQLLSKLTWERYLRQTLENLLMKYQFSAVLIRYAMSNGYMFRSLMQRNPGVLWGFEINSLAYHHLNRFPARVRNLILRAELAGINRADFLYVVSEKLRLDILPVCPFWERRIIVCPNGGPSVLHTRVLEVGNVAELKFVYLGMLQPYYDFELLIDAFKEVADSETLPISLHFFGDGPQLEKARISADNHEMIRFHGRYDLDELLRSGKVDRQTVLILPYNPVGLTEIHSPIKLFEYMALGLPILASNVGQIGVILKDGISARLYHPGDRCSLIEEIRWMVRNQELHKHMAAKLIESYSKVHTWEARMASFLKSLSSVPKRDNSRTMEFNT